MTGADSEKAGRTAASSCTDWEKIQRIKMSHSLRATNVELSSDRKCQPHPHCRDTRARAVTPILVSVNTPTAHCPRTTYSTDERIKSYISPPSALDTDHCHRSATSQPHLKPDSSSDPSIHQPTTACYESTNHATVNTCNGNTGSRTKGVCSPNHLRTIAPRTQLRPTQ